MPIRPSRRFRLSFAILPALVIAIVQAWPASAQGAAHEDPVAHVVLALAIILAAAKLAGHLAIRVGQPAVLGELMAGVILGNLTLAGVDAFSHIAHDPAVDILARLGVIVLLFEVGLESTVRDMLDVGLPSLWVALLGVAAPFALGWGVGAMLLPDRSVYVHAFLGATLTATSVGITARVLSDMNKSKTPEARVILGAAVIDDVLGLVILAVVAGIISAANQGTTLSAGDMAIVLGKAMGFLFGALLLGTAFSPRLFKVASRLRGQGVLLASALVFCFALSWLSSLVGLSPIVGAYAAGLILEDVHFKGFEPVAERSLEHLLRPISTFLVPVFFVLMGMMVDLRTFGRVEMLGLAAVLTIAAIVGKQVCSLAPFGRPLDRLSIGIGMVPRGEVGLIFANIGLGLSVAGERIVDEGVFSAVVIMVIVTTMATPPALKWSLSRQRPTGSVEAAG